MYCGAALKCEHFKFNLEYLHTHAYYIYISQNCGVHYLPHLKEDIRGLPFTISPHSVCHMCNCNR